MITLSSSLQKIIPDLWLKCNKGVAFKKHLCHTSVARKEQRKKCASKQTGGDVV